MVKRSLFAVVILAFLLSGCGAAPTMAPSAASRDSYNSAVPAAPQAPAEAGGGSSSAGNPYAVAEKSLSNPAELQPTAQAGNGANQPAVERIVIRNAEMTIVVPDPIKAMETIAKLAGDNDGFVVASNAYKVSLEDGSQAPEATISIRVASAKLDSVMTSIRGLVKQADQDVLNEHVTGQDVTKEYTDLQSRLKNLQQAEAQLREIMASATRPEDVLNIFNQLTQVREQIEVIQGQINYYKESSDLSLIDVTLKAEASVKPLTIGSWQPAGVARDALQSTVNGLKFVANAAIWLVLFVLPIGAAIVIPIWLLVAGIRWLRRRNRPSRPVIPPAGTPPAAA